MSRSLDSGAETLITQILKVLIKQFFAFKYFPFLEIWKKHDRDSKNVVVVFANWPKKLLQYIYSDSLVADLSLIKAVAAEFDDLRIKLSVKDMGGILDSRVFFTIGYRFNISKYRNPTTSILQFIDQLEEQGNTVIPNRHDVEWWENKEFMHRRFDEVGVKTPPSYILDLHMDDESIPFDFPFLVKEIHSAGARGITKIDDEKQFRALISDPKLKQKNGFVIVQKLLNINRDLRVVLVGDEVLYHHWRLNDDVEEWEPTTYKKGKKGDFGSFPEEWRDYIVAEFKKTGLLTGAFDLTWENNDMSQTPYVLEISPAYFPNPTPPESVDKDYGDYKHGISFKEPWEKHFVLRSDDLKEKLVKEYLALVR